MHKSFTRLLTTVLAFAACAPDPAPESPPASVPEVGQALLEFEARVDPSAGTIEPIPGTLTSARGLGAAVVAQNGTPGVGPPSTLELVTTNAALDADGSGACGFPSSFCADVTVRSFYGHRLDNVFVQLRRITPAAGHAALNSDASAFGLSNTLGLWGYGSLAPNAANTRQWVLGDDGTPYNVAGRVMVDVFLTSWEVSLDGGMSFAPVTLPDTGWGCDNCSRQYRATIPFAPSAVAFRWSSDNFARMFVNGTNVFNDFFIGGFCTDQPCCARCCDTPGNCLAGLSNPQVLDAAELTAFQYGAVNTILWEVVEEVGGDGFYVEMTVTP